MHLKVIIKILHLKITLHRPYLVINKKYSVSTSMKFLFFKSVCGSILGWAMHCHVACLTNLVTCLFKLPD